MGVGHKDRRLSKEVKGWGEEQAAAEGSKALVIALSTGTTTARMKSD